jgi:hypothetical protein
MLPRLHFNCNLSVMKITKLFILLSIAYYVAAAKPKAENFEKGMRFKSIKCSTDNKTAILKVCSLKAYSRRAVGLNLGIDFPEPLERPLYLQVLMRVSTGLNFHTMIDTNLVEWCSVMDGSEGHLYIQQIIKKIRRTAPTLFHKCPYNGIDVKNVTIDLNSFNEAMWLPSGEQKVYFIGWKDGKVIASVNVTIETKVSREDYFKLDTFIKKIV